jgi:hypothetical protein
MMGSRTCNQNILINEVLEFNYNLQEFNLKS